MGGAMTLWLCVGVAGLVLAILNIVSTIRLWRSSQYERFQKVAQTLLTWLVPGFAVAVMLMLGNDRRKSSTVDSGASDPGINPWIMNGPPDQPSDTGGGGPPWGGWPPNKPFQAGEVRGSAQNLVSSPGPRRSVLAFTNHGLAAERTGR